VARDPELEELVYAELGDLAGLSGKVLFGGWAFLLNGNLLCGVRPAGLMLRIGADNESWALTIPGVEPAAASAATCVRTPTSAPTTSSAGGCSRPPWRLPVRCRRSNGVGNSSC